MARASSVPAIAVVLSPCPPKPLASHTPGLTSPICNDRSRASSSRFICVAGPSGSGKSSLVQAGSLHALQQDKIAGSDKWLYATLTPRSDPIEQLAQAMARLAKTPVAADYLRQQG